MNVIYLVGFPGGSVIKNPPAKKEMWDLALSGKMPWKRKWQPTPVFLLGNLMDRSLMGYSPWGQKQLGMT